MVDPERSALMKRVRQRDTAPELRVRAILTKLGARYRVNVKDLPGSPDLANKGLKKAVFVHGCFWHGHENCSKHRLPKNNRPFWESKFKANIARDQRKIEALIALGYAVHVVWECQLRDPALLADELRTFWYGPGSHDGTSSVPIEATMSADNSSSTR